MKAKHNLLSSRFTGYRPLLISGLIASFPFAANAADLFWDGADTGADAQGGTGTWLNGITSNWDTLATGGTDSVWTNANNDTAVFGGTAGTVTIDTADDLGVAAGGITFGTANYTITGETLTLTSTATISNAVTATISSVIAGSVGLTKTGNGTLLLRNDNTFTGNLTISAGTLQLGNNSDIGSLGAGSYAGDISIAAGATFFDKSNSIQILSGVISGGGTLNKGGGGMLTLSGANTYTGKTIIAGSGAGGPGITISSFNSVNESETGAVMASSSLGAPTTIANGTIQFGNSGNQRSSTLIYTGSGETTNRVMNVQFNTGAKHTISNTGGGLLNFTSNFTINPSSGNTGGGLILRGSGNGQIAQIGTLPGILEKADGGTWTIGGTNGANSVNVSGGKLLVNGTMNVTTTVAVASGATLGGNATVGGAITVNNGGTLSAGNGSGQFTVGSTLTLAATSNTLMELGGTTMGTTYDQVSLDTLATALTYGGNLNVVAISLFDMDLASFTYDLFDLKLVTATGDFASVTVNSILLSNSAGLWTGSNGDVNYSFAQSTGDLTITVIPEPSVALLGGLGLLALLRRRR